MVHCCRSNRDSRKPLRRRFGQCTSVIDLIVTVAYQRLSNRDTVVQCYRSDYDLGVQHYCNVSAIPLLRVFPAATVSVR